MTEVLLGSAVFAGIVLMLAVLVLAARAFLVPSGVVLVRVNGDDPIEARTGDSLLSVLARSGIAIPSGCGGAGTCGQCRVRLTEGLAPPWPTEAALLSRAELSSGLRLACQTKLSAEIAVDLPESLRSATSRECVVVSSRTIAPIIREITLAPVDGAAFDFEPGAFVQIEAPAYDLAYADYDIAPEHRAAWDQLDLMSVRSKSGGGVSRAYSIASRPDRKAGEITLLVRLAVPPPNHPEAPPGIVSSWLFGLKSGTKVKCTGPFSSFGAQDTDREMVFIGGGVGMAPLRAIIWDQLARRKTDRTISFWYGARSRVDLFYETEFTRLAERHSNFRWTPALSDPAPEDDWHGEVGFVHEVALRAYLATHPAPHNCEYYLCGPPMMIRATLAMLDDLGVEPDHIFNDDFGG